MQEHEGCVHNASHNPDPPYPCAPKTTACLTPYHLTPQESTMRYSDCHSSTKSAASCASKPSLEPRAPLQPVSPACQMGWMGGRVDDEVYSKVQGSAARGVELCTFKC